MTRVNGPGQLLFAKNRRRFGTRRTSGRGGRFGQFVHPVRQASKVRLLHQVRKLSGLAEGGINQGAADAAHSDDEEPVGAAAGSARKSSASRAAKALRNTTTCHR
jgi:hypothetical protein